MMPTAVPEHVRYTHPGSVEARRVGTEDWRSFPTVKTAALVLGVQRSSVSNCLAFRQKTSGGFEFRRPPTHVHVR